MNKNRAILMIIALCNTVALPVTKSEARTIRKDLYANYADNKLTSAQLVESGLTMNEVIDRDLRIMIDHRDLLQGKIDGYKSFFTQYVALVFNAGIAGGAGTVSILAALYAINPVDLFTPGADLFPPKGTVSSEFIPVAVAISAVAGLLSRYCFNNICKYERVIPAQIEKIQKRLNLDQAIIRQFKGMIYRLAQ